LHRQKRYSRTPKGKFQLDRQHAKDKGEEWHLTFEQWWAKWEPHWKKRGKKLRQYSLYRLDPALPYTDENTVVGTNKDRHAHRKHLQEQAMIRAFRESYFGDLYADSDD